MENSGPLVLLGFAIIVSTAIAILVPYLRGKSDVLTMWNIMLLGGSMFMGIGSLAVRYGTFHWVELQWFQPTREDVQKYVIGSILFYATLYFTYFYLTWPKKVASHFFNKWPPFNFAFLMTWLTIFGIIAVGGLAFRQYFFIGALLINTSHKALIFATVFSFCYWYQNRGKIALFFLFLGVFVFAALDAMVVYHGRRLLLSVAVAPLICMYWMRWRYLPPRQNLLRVAIATMLMFSVAAVYSTFRHFSSRGHTERTFSTTIAALKGTSAQGAIEGVVSNPYYYLSQYCGHYSLLTIHLLEMGQVEVEPLNSLTFFATYPIPRSIFPAKPQSLGIRIVSDVLRLPYPTNWGLGIVANGYQEGGVLVIMLYAFMIVMGVRLVDDALVRQPNNPFLLAILATAAPHCATLFRGEFMIMSAEIIEACLFAWAIGWVSRGFFGRAREGSFQNFGQTPFTVPPQFGRLPGQFRN